MPSPTRKTGDIGENIAIIFLKNNGFSIVDRNYGKPFGEIDIIAKIAGCIHFIEVKSTSYNIPKNNVSCETWKIYKVEEHHDNTYLPEWNITKNKTKRLSCIIKAYISEYKLYNSNISIDICSIIYKANTCEADMVFLENISLFD